ncbi:unnamed protein product [Diamesa serratosioi]
MKIVEIMSKIKNNLKSSKKTKKFIPNLSAVPNHICFKDYDGGSVYRETIQVLNRDLKTYYLTIKFDNPDEIKLTIVGSVSRTKIDSGEDLLLEVEFRPNLSYRKESVDRRYEICLKVINSNAKFLIPVLVLSPNPMINFPKEISLPDTAINIPAYSNIFVLNYTSLNQKFSFDCKNELKIIPDCKTISLRACDGSSYLIEFIPKATGCFREKIVVCFESGKKLFILMKCNVTPVNIFLDTEYIEFSPTFIGMVERQSINIVNNSEEASFYQWIPQDLLNQKEDKIKAEHYLKIELSSGEILPNSVTKVDFMFKPEDTDDDDYDIFKEITINMVLKLSLDPDYHPVLHLKGRTIGPSFQLDIKHIDIGSVYLGEHRLIAVNIANTGIIKGKIMFQKSPTQFDGIVKISSKSETLAPDEVKPFTIKYLARRAGKFVDQVYFKVKNGEKLSFTIHGSIKQLNVLSEPKKLQFYEIPICVPQMCCVMVKNPMPFDVDVTCEIDNQGTDAPLSFMEFFKSNCEPVEGQGSSKTPSATSFTSKISFKSSLTYSESCSSLLTRKSVKNFMDRTGKLQHMRDSIVSDDNAIKNLYEKVENYLENTDIVESIIRIIFEKDLNEEMEKRFIIGIIIDLLLGNLNEFGADDFIAFDSKDWNFPENPKDLELNESIFTIPAESFYIIKVFLTSNYIGKFTRYLRLQCLLSNGSSCPKESVDETIISMPISFDCSAPQICVHNKMNSIFGYAESEIPLEIVLENVGNVDGFFKFQQYSDVELEVRSVGEKFHIAHGTKKSMNLIVTPLKSGVMMKFVEIIILGSNRKIPISIECKSLPPDIVIKPLKVIEDQLEVLVTHKSRIYIENKSTTKARFFIRLENDVGLFNVSPQGGILCPQQCALVMIEMLFYDPGDYKNMLHVEVVNSKVIKIPIRCTVRNLPILMEPKISRVVDFGTLFISKTPYFLEYNFTNAGKHTYMIFVILKNWKNKNEIRYKIEPNRFELAPNKSQILKVFLSAENVTTNEEDFTIEGCSTQHPTREIIWESKLKANVIRPTLSFSKSELVFQCYYGMKNQDIETIRVSNKSNLPLPVALKIEGEFYLLAHDSTKFEQKVKFDLKLMENRDICIHFNSNLMKQSNQFRTYEGKIKAYSLGKLQCTLSLQANMIYPVVEISKTELNISNNLLPMAFQFEIFNPGKIDATFSLRFTEASNIMTKIQERKQENLLNISQCLMKQKSSLRQKFFAREDPEKVLERILYDDEDNIIDDSSSSFNELHTLTDVNISNVQKQSSEKKRSKNVRKNETPKEDETLRTLSVTEDTKEDFTDVEVSLKDILKYFKTLSRALSETVVSRNANQERKSSTLIKMLDNTKNEYAEKFLKLSQSQGVLSPYERRMISVYFVGTKDAFHLSTVLCCSVVGGISHDIIINFTNCSANILITKTYFEISNQHQWNDILMKNICVSNISPTTNAIELFVEKVDARLGCQQLRDGFIKMNNKTELKFLMDEERNFCCNIKFTIFMGCTGLFWSEFGLQVNNKPPIPISFFGKSLIPTATLLDVERKSLYKMNRDFEYDSLRLMFKYVDKIRVPDEDIKFEDVLKVKMRLKLEMDLAASPVTKVKKKYIKKDKKKELVKESTILSLKNVDASGDGPFEEIQKEFGYYYGTNGKVVRKEKCEKLYSAKMLQMVDEVLEECDYVAIDYPAEYPEAIEITNFIIQQGLVRSLETEEVFKDYKKIYNHYSVDMIRQCNTAKNAGQTASLDCDVWSLPLLAHEYQINLGTIQMNESISKVIQLIFHGNDLGAALRCDTIIPGMHLYFIQTSEVDHQFKIVTYNNVSPGSNCKYQNRDQRKKVLTFDEQCSMIKRSHSFDFTSAKVHTRKIRDRLEMNQYYNDLIRTKKLSLKEPKSPFLHAEIFQDQGFKDAKLFQFQIDFEPTNQHYDDHTEFDEYIYLDVSIISVDKSSL